MRIFKTLVQMTDGDILAIDTIEHEGKLWLVPEWRVGPAAGFERPAKLIGLDGLPIQPVSPERRTLGDQELLCRLSRETLAGETTQGLEIREEPALSRSVSKRDPTHH